MQIEISVLHFHPSLSANTLLLSLVDVSHRCNFYKSENQKHNFITDWLKKITTNVIE